MSVYFTSRCERCGGFGTRSRDGIFRRVRSCELCGYQEEWRYALHADGGLREETSRRGGRGTYRLRGKNGAETAGTLPDDFEPGHLETLFDMERIESEYDASHSYIAFCSGSGEVSVLWGDGELPTWENGHVRDLTDEARELWAHLIPSLKLPPAARRALISQLCRYCEDRATCERLFAMPETQLRKERQLLAIVLSSAQSLENGLDVPREMRIEIPTRVRALVMNNPDVTTMQSRNER